MERNPENTFPEKPPSGEFRNPTAKLLTPSAAGKTVNRTADLPVSPNKVGVVRLPYIGNGLLLPRSIGVGSMPAYYF